MKTVRFICFALAIMFVGQSYGQLDPRSVIQANYDKISRLSLKKDKVNLERVIRRNASSSFVYIDAFRNTLDLSATVRQNTEQLSQVHKFIANSNKIIGVKENGHDLICMVKTDYDVYLDAAGKNRVKGTSISKDTWTKTLTGWKIRRSLVVKESTKQNGKAVH